MTSADGTRLQALPDEQIGCYRAIATEYERHALPFPRATELTAALDAYRTADELIEGEESSTIRRRLLDGTAYQIVKVPHRPRELERRLARVGRRIEVHPASGPFYRGAGSRV